MTYLAKRQAYSAIPFQASRRCLEKWSDAARLRAPSSSLASVRPLTEKHHVRFPFHFGLPSRVVSHVLARRAPMPAAKRFEHLRAASGFGTRLLKESHIAIVSGRSNFDYTRWMPSPRKQVRRANPIPLVRYIIPWHRLLLGTQIVVLRQMIDVSTYILEIRVKVTFHYQVGS